jgi:hypothetical protein
LNKAIAFRRVEPLHSACRHVTSPGYDPTTLAQRTVKMKWVATQKLTGPGPARQAASVTDVCRFCARNLVAGYRYALEM